MTKTIWKLAGLAEAHLAVRIAPACTLRLTGATIGRGKRLRIPSQACQDWGDVPPVEAMVRQVILQETYQVRNLLSRGAVIDLVG